MLVSDCQKLDIVSIALTKASEDKEFGPEKYIYCVASIPLNAF